MRWTPVALASIVVVSASAQTVPPVRDVDRPPTIGTASVSGRVVTDEPGAPPVRRAVVSLTGDGLRPNRGAITDDEGRFRIESLPAGRFTLTVSRSSFITSAYGASRPGRPGTPLVVRDGEAVAGLVVRLWRGAALAGVIRDETGAPLEGIPVTAVPARAASGPARSTLSNNGAVTNDLGEFRLFGLVPGTYVISATPTATSPGAIRAMPDAEVDAALASLARRTPASAIAPTRTLPSAPPPTFDYAPIFYPGTPSRGQATPVTLSPGAEQVGLDFALQRVATVTVEGAVSRTDGQPAAGAAVQLVEAVVTGPFAPATPLLFGAVTGSDGRFRIARVTTGAYHILARAGGWSGSAPPPMPVATLPVADGSPGLWAAADVSVADRDVTGLELALQPGRTLAGRVRFEGSQPPPDPASLHVSLVPPSVLAQPSGTPIRTLQSVMSARVRGDGTFEVPGVGPGLYSLRVSAPGLDGWWLRSAIRSGRDLLDGHIDVDSSTDLDNVLITFADRRTTLSGTLQTPAGVPVTDVYVIVFAADPRHWGPASRRVQAARPASDGRFSFIGLPAGAYRLAAVVDIEQDHWQEPAFLTLAAPGSIPVTLAEGDATVQDLQLGAR
jgi:hypothetical protein